MNTVNKRREKVTILLGGTFLLSLILSGWIPRDCPYLKQLIAPCPTQIISNQPITEEEKDIARIPHQALEKSLATFTVQAQDFRETTDVRFSFRGDLTHQIGWLGYQTDQGPTVVALVTHPLLHNLTWPRLKTVLPNTSVYSKSGTLPATIDELRASSLNPATTAVDSVIAKRWELSDTQYVLLDTLTSLDGIETIITSYSMPTPDGGWSQYLETFDASDAKVNTLNQLEWFIDLPDVTGGSTPFRLSTVNINYRSLR